MALGTQVVDFVRLHGPDELVEGAGAICAVASVASIACGVGCIIASIASMASLRLLGMLRRLRVRREKWDTRERQCTREASVKHAKGAK